MKKEKHSGHKKKKVSNTQLWKGSLHREGRKLLIPVIGILMIVIFSVIQILLESSAVKPDTSDLIRISELTTDNTNTTETADTSEDWIEISNDGDRAVNLRNYLLYCEASLARVFVFPDYTLQPNEYVIISADGTFRNNGNEWSAPFKLNASGGDTLILKNNLNTIIDSVYIPEIRKGRSYARGDDDSWYETIIITPGQANQIESKLTVKVEVQDIPADLAVPEFSEVMTNNTMYAIGPDNTFGDYIELYNPTAQQVDLNGWWLSDDEENTQKWALPNARMQPQSYLAVTCGQSDSEEVENTVIKLSKRGETLYLTHNDYGTVRFLKIPRLERNSAYSLSGDTWTTDLLPTPGRRNTVSEGIAFIHEVFNDTPRLRLNEIMANPKGEGADWIEIYNGTAQDIDLSGYGLTDNSSKPRKWQFPDGTSIDSGDYMVIEMAGPKYSGHVSDSAADFSLSADGGYSVMLSNAAGTVLDAIFMPIQSKGVSYGRMDGHDTFVYMTEPTRNAKNAGTVYPKYGGPVQFSLEGGSYGESSLTLELSAAMDAEIHYTTDGTEPNKSSKLYTSPITINENSIIRAYTGGTDALPSDIVTKSYILNHSTALRTVCITGNKRALISSNGVLNTGSKKEQPVYLEIYDYDGTPMISQSCALKLAGKGSRVDFKQKGFKLLAKKSYGPGKFKAKLFTNRDYTEYDSIVMRASGQDAYKTHMRDSILTSLAADTSVMYAESELCAVFINGNYWGEYNMRENINEDSICQFEGWEGDNESIDILVDTEMRCTHGSSSSYKAMMSFVDSHSLSDDANVEQLGEMMDIDNYLDYVCLAVYVDHEDMGNVSAYRNANADGKWRWVFFDQDLSYANDKNSMRMWIEKKGLIGSVTPQDNTLFYSLMKNEKMRDKFLTRMGELLATTFSSANLQQKINERYQAIKDEMVYSCKRWSVDYSTFNKRTKTMHSYAGSRTYKLIGYIADAFHLSDEQIQQYFSEALANESAAMANQAEA